MDFCKIAILNVNKWEETLGREETVATRKMTSLCPNTAPTASLTPSMTFSSVCDSSELPFTHSLQLSSNSLLRQPSQSQHNDISAPHSAVSPLFRGHGDRTRRKSNFRTEKKKKLSDVMRLFKNQSWWLGAITGEPHRTKSVLRH